MREFLDRLVDPREFADFSRLMARQMPPSAVMKLHLKDDREIFGRLTPHPDVTTAQWWIWSFTDRAPNASVARASLSHSRVEPTGSVQKSLVQSMFASMSDGFVLQDASGKVMDFNARALQVLGITSDQLLGKTSFDPQWKAIREDLSDYPKSEHPAVIALTTGRAVPPTLMGMRLSPTSTRWLTVRATPLFAEADSRPHQVAITFSDVTEQRQAAKELAEAQRFLRTVADNIPGMVAYWSPDLRCLFANKSYEEWFGRTSSEVIGTTMQELMGPELFQRNEPYIRNVLSGEVQQFERKLRKSDGSYGFTWAQYVPDIHDGVIRGFFVLVSDISRLRELEVRLTERLDVALSAANIGAWSLDLRTDETWRSANHDSLFGFNTPRAAWHRSDLLDRVVPDDRARVARELADGLKTTRFKIDCGIQLAETGDLRWIVIEGQTSLDAFGAPVHMIGIVTDVTERRNADKSLREALEWRHIILDSANLSIISTDTLGGIRTFNAGAEKLLGYRADEVVGKATPALIHREQEVIQRAADLSKELGTTIQPGFESFVAKARDFDGPDENQWTYVRKDGSAVPVRLSVTALRDRSGIVTGYLGIAQDISDLAQAMAEAARYHDALDRTAIVAFTDSRGVITHANDGFCQISGHSRQELVGKTHKIVNSGAHPASFFQDLWRTISSGKAWRGEVCNRRRDGSIYWVDSTILPSFDGGGKIGGYIAIRIDITDRKRVEAELEVSRSAALAAAAAKSQFLAKMSHEIRTPMGGVIGMAELLLETPLAEDQKSYAQSILDCGESLLSIVNDVLDFSKIEADKLEVETIDFSITELAESRLDIVAAKAREKNLILSGFVTPHMPSRVAGDPTRIGQVLLNLLSNAIKFTESGSVVCRTTVTSENSSTLVARFEVIDSGIGLDEAQRSVLFQPFAQADATMARRFGGTGLGLSICKRLVELMGGTIGVTSAIGHGSTFWFEVPLTRSASDREGPRWPRELTAVRMILVVEEENRRHDVQQYFEAWGLPFETCAADLTSVESLAAYGPPPDSLRQILFVDATTPATRRLSELILGGRLPHGLKAIVASEGRAGYGPTGVAAADSVVVLRTPLHQSHLLNAIMTWTGLAAGAEAPRTGRAEGADLRAPIGPARRILVAEDNHVNQVLISKFLERLGHSVQIAHNGLEALAALEAASFDLVLMDCQMPEMDGYETTRRIRQRNSGNAKHLPIVALTAHAMTGELETCLAAGMDDYLTKPISRTRIAKTLEKWLTAAPVSHLDAEMHPSIAVVGGAPVADSSPPTGLVDYRRILDSLGDDDDTFREVAAAFTGSALETMEQLRTAVANGDSKQIEFQAHKFKSAVGIFQVQAAIDMAQTLEKKGALGDLRGVAEVFRELERIAHEVTRELEHRLNIAAA